LSPAFKTETCHYCRNKPHCGLKLKEPVENPRQAFCTPGCFASFHRHRCLVCQEPMERRRENQHVCGKRSCLRQFRLNRAQFFAGWPDPQAVVEFGSERPDFTASKPPPRADLWCTKDGRGWRWEEESPDDWLLLDRDGRLAAHLNHQAQGWRVVHPRVIPEVIELDLTLAKARALPIALASLPLHPSTRRDYAKTNRLPSGARLLALQDLPPEQRKAALQPEVVDAAVFSTPLNLLNGHRFANAPALDVRTRRAIHDLEINPPRLVEVESSPICPDAPDGDLDRVPPFLDRRPPAGAPSRPRAIE
jgi:hypothetical protein